MRYDDVGLLAPPLREKVATVLSRTASLGLAVYAFETFRSSQRQSELYAQGRSLPGPVVTNARPGGTWHNYGLAVDFAFKTERGMWTWSGDWAALGREIESAGFLWLGRRGTTFFDPPHAQLTGAISSIAEARQLMKKGGLNLVWQTAFPNLDLPETTP